MPLPAAMLRRLARLIIVAVGAAGTGGIVEAGTSKASSQASSTGRTRVRLVKLASPVTLVTPWLVLPAQLRSGTADVLICVASVPGAAPFRLAISGPATQAPVSPSGGIGGSVTSAECPSGALERLLVDPGASGPIRIDVEFE